MESLMKLLLINDILRHTYGFKDIRSLKGENSKSYSFKTKYSDTQFTGTFFEREYDPNLKVEDVDLSDDIQEVIHSDAKEKYFAVEFDNQPNEKEIGLLKRIREKFAENDCFVSLYNTTTDEALEI